MSSEGSVGPRKALLKDGTGIVCFRYERLIQGTRVQR